MLEDEHKQMTEWEARHTFTDSFRSAAEVSCMSCTVYCLVEPFVGGLVWRYGKFFNCRQIEVNVCAPMMLSIQLTKFKFC